MKLNGFFNKKKPPPQKLEWRTSLWNRSCVLRSPRAVQVNIAIMRAFVQLRELLATNRDLARRLDELESQYDDQFRAVFDAIRELMRPPDKPRPRIGFTSSGNHGA
jgi:hypothetical protein